MKQLSSTLALLFIFLIIGKAQYSNRISLNLSFNKIDVGYKYNFNQLPVWSEAFIGLGNQDINTGFDDLLSYTSQDHDIIKYEWDFDYDGL